MPTLDTERLVLDPLRADDAAGLFACRADPAVARYQGWKPADEAEAAAFIAGQARQVFGTPGSWCQLAIRDRASGELLGDIGVHFPPTTDDAVEFGVSLKPGAQGRGYAREAVAAVIDHVFHDCGYRRVIASVDPRNVASMALCRSLGMRREAHHAQSRLVRGEWVDDVVFALLAREWP